MLRFSAPFALLLLTACTAADGQAPTASASSDFRVVGADVAGMTPVNLCAALGGRGDVPPITVRHSAMGGERIRVRMYDVHNDGTTTEHGRTTVRSDASGATVVDYGFRPPCNTTKGRLSSSYRFDVAAGGRTFTKGWADYDSATGRIR